jgi:cyclase
MLKTRVIPIVLWKMGGIVKGRGFDHSRNVGTVLPAIKVYNTRDIDELMLLDVHASISQQTPRFNEVEVLARECSVPLTVGGGVTCLDDIESLLRAGADKVLLNTVCYDKPELVRQASNRFGSQCVVVGIDYRDIDGRLLCFSHAGQRRREWSIDGWARRVEDQGAGEIVLTSCARDGMMNGFDLETVARVVESIGVPVVAAGGAGNLDHFVEVVRTAGANAVAAGSVFHFTEITPQAVKEHLGLAGVPVRLGIGR